MSDHLPAQARVGNAQREAAVNALAAHRRAGRLDESEYDERADQANAARIQGDLDALFADLPGGAPSTPIPPTGEPVIAPYQPPPGATVTRPQDGAPPAGPVPGPAPVPAAPVPPPVMRLLAISGGLATVLFLILGFAFRAWAWAWIVFLIPGLVRGYYGLNDGKGGRRGC